MKHQECKRLGHVPLEFAPIWEPLDWYNTIFLFYFLQPIALYCTKESLYCYFYITYGFYLKLFVKENQLHLMIIAGCQLVDIENIQHPSGIVGKISMQKVQVIVTIIAYLEQMPEKQFCQHDRKYCDFVAFSKMMFLLTHLVLLRGI